MGHTPKKAAHGASHNKMRARIIELHGQGLSRAAVAREIGTSPSTVGRHAKAIGLEWDRSQTAKAVAAKTVDLAARRARLVERMMDAAEGALDVLEAGKIEIVKITELGKVVRAERDIDMIDRRNAVTVSGIAVDKATKLLDRDTGTEGATSTLDALEAAIGAAARGLMDGDQTHD